jgi:hypothetical protein
VSIHPQAAPKPKKQKFQSSFTPSPPPHPQDFPETREMQLKAAPFLLSAVVAAFFGWFGRAK